MTPQPAAIKDLNADISSSDGAPSVLLTGDVSHFDTAGSAQGT
jgi:hypothetical protein